MTFTKNSCVKTNNCRLWVTWGTLFKSRLFAVNGSLHLSIRLQYWLLNKTSFSNSNIDNQPCTGFKWQMHKNYHRDEEEKMKKNLNLGDNEQPSIKGSQSKRFERRACIWKSLTAWPWIQALLALRYEKMCSNSRLTTWGSRSLLLINR